MSSRFNASRLLIVAIAAALQLLAVGTANAGAAPPQKPVATAKPKFDGPWLGVPPDRGQPAYTGKQVVCHKADNPLGGSMFVRMTIDVAGVEWMTAHPTDVLIAHPDDVCRSNSTGYRAARIFTPLIYR